MSLSCSCEWDPEPGDITWYPPNDYSLFDTNKRKRCCSCKELIEIGAISAKFNRSKTPDSDIEVNIYGEDGEVPRAPSYMCEHCADLYFSLDELGFCVNITDDMRDLAKEYADTYGKKQQ